MIRTSRTLVGVGAAAAILLAAGCSSSSKHNDKASSTAPTSSGSPTLVQNQPPSSIANDPAKRPAVTITQCGAVSGGWSAAGTAKNTGKSSESFEITIVFTAAGGTVQDYAVGKLSVDAGKTGKWETEKTFAAQLATMCVLRGVG
jgi:hypothetical protein